MMVHRSSSTFYDDLGSPSLLCDDLGSSLLLHDDSNQDSRLVLQDQLLRLPVLVAAVREVSPDGEGNFLLLELFHGDLPLPANQRIIG